ncbi:hypothetical protein K1719_041064 [Acacia pycnantha]|nr:hypothetical protein K1719_041064 [Acacia pycnantha]
MKKEQVPLLKQQRKTYLPEARSRRIHNTRITGYSRRKGKIIPESQITRECSGFAAVGVDRKGEGSDPRWGVRLLRRWMADQIRESRVAGVGEVKPPARVEREWGIESGKKKQKSKVSSLFVKKKGQSSPTTIVIVVVSIIGSGLLLGFAYYLLWRKMQKRRRDGLRQKYFGSEGTALEPLQFSLATIETATNQFSHENSLGKGGFGQVYKGILSNGQEIAVKRLSKVSGQGAKEFKNEVLLIAKLQHRNLVVLLGFCIDEQEKMLIYEYVPNRSLDDFLFGSQNSKVLTWLERSKIIKGVTQGILYLHDYSRLKIIHRDLKPSNILLDDEMNPKISDFGLAKMVAINENEGNTNTIVGTYGYMSPEYAMFGQYSNKSDVFSFGVIILEIICGRKNASSHNQSQYADSLLSYAWNQWKDEKFLEILDSNLKELESFNEMTKCIHIGLLCVQENPEARPSMATIISYLSDDSIQLPIPQEPAFFLHGQMDRNNVESQSGESCSTNEVSKSEFFPR